LREVVGADALRAVARTHLALARIGPSGVQRLALDVVELGLEVLHRLATVLVLALLRGGHHHAGRDVGDADRRVGLVDVLAARARRAIGIDAQIGVVDLDLDILGFRQNRDGGGGGVDAPLRLGLRHALNAVDAALELQPAEHALAGDRGDDFLVAAHLAFGDAIDLYAPAVVLGVALVHAEEIAREQRRLVAASAGAHFQDGRGVLVLVARGQQQGDLALQVRQLLLQPLQFVARQLRHLRIVGGRHGLQIGAFGSRLRQRLHEVGHRLQLGVFLGEAHDLGAVAGRAHARFHLAEAVENLVETGLGESHGACVARLGGAVTLRKVYPFWVNALDGAVTVVSIWHT